MTTYFKLLRFHGRRPRFNAETLCAPCVYFSRNLDNAEYPVLMEKHDDCGLGFLPGDNACAEMRTDNCRARKSR